LIFITGYADEVLEKEASRLEPVAYLYKPFDAFKASGPHQEGDFPDEPLDPPKLLNVSLKTQIRKYQK